MSVCRIGDKNHFYGRKHSEEARALIKLHHADLNGENNPKAKKIYMYDVQGNYLDEFQTLTEAEKIVQYTSHQQIAKVASGKRKTCGGFQWRYFKTDKIPPVRYENKKMLEYNGELRTVDEWADILRITRKDLDSRLKQNTFYEILQKEGLVP